MLKLFNIEAGYGASQVLHGMNMQVDSGQVVSLLGRNGMGKTTTVKTITGLLSATSGQILFEDIDLTKLSSFRIAQQGIGLAPEGRQIFPNLSVRENIIATQADRHASASPWTLGSIYELFPALSQRQNHMGDQLSGGEQQMLAIARALMTNPKIVNTGRSN